MQYESVGYASIRLSVDGNGEVLLCANEDGFRSLLQLFNQFLEPGASTSDHIHLLPGMQLASDSLSFAVAFEQDEPDAG